jgi:hypothetical protein
MRAFNFWGGEMNLKNLLQEEFSMLRDRSEVLKEIDESHKLSEMFYGWEEDEQEEFLNICTGVKGVKILYDAFFKEVWSTRIKIALCAMSACAGAESKIRCKK